MNLHEAVEAARHGDPDAIAALYRAHAAPLLSFLVGQTASREDAEDLLGEVFVAAIRDLGRFEGDAGAFKGWIYRIATNRAIDQARRRNRRPERPLADVGDAASEDDPEADAVAAAERVRVWRAVRDLPRLQRIVISLRLTSGLSTAEIAEVLGKQTNAVKALQHRALKGLAKALGPYPAEPAERLEP